MTKQIQLPEISENVNTGDVIKVLVKVGDIIEAEQAIVEIETEKAAFEVPSPLKGKITKILVQEGDTVKVGQPLAEIDTESQTQTEEEEATEESMQKELTPAPESASKKSTPQPESKSEQMKQSDPFVTEKSAETAEIKAEEALVDESQNQKASEKPPTPSTAEVITKTAAGESVIAAPSVRQLAHELGVVIEQVVGTGFDGRILAEDVKEHAKIMLSQSVQSQPATVTKSLPDFSKWGNIHREKVSVTRKKIAESLSYTWSHIPQVTQYDQADITELDKFRRQYAKTVEQAGGKPTITSILMKVVANALKKFPKFNASFDPDANEIIYKSYYHISVAVDTDRDLLVPVVRDVVQKNILALSVELSELSEKARQHRVTPDEMVGGNITISNLGSIGGTQFAPILYWPQVAILGVSRAAPKAVYINGILEQRTILPLSLSYDHRIIDGAEGLRFLRYIIDALESPFILAIQEKLKGIIKKECHMDIFQFAIEKETFSHEYYLQLAQKTSHDGLKSICNMLADEEEKHGHIIENLSRGVSPEVAQSPILDEAKRLFEKMRRSVDQFNINISELELYRKAIDIEQESRRFYLEKAGLVQDDVQKAIFEKLAREERKHEVLLENICECILQPQRYLAGAEFYHIDHDI